jgi:S-adenosylmethionine:diacylglycerol 3-amino-3-carboxypropyl transferase
MAGDDVMRARSRARSPSAAPLVYNQTCEDTEVDLEVHRPTVGMRIFTVASGGCHVVRLAQAGADVVAVDNNPAQIALTELKVEAARRLRPEQFLDIFRSGSDPQRWLDQLDLSSQTRDHLTRRRWFDERGLYRRSRVGRASRLLRWWVHVSGAAPLVTEVFAATSLDDQAKAWREAWRRMYAWPGRGVLATRWPLVLAGVPPRVATMRPGLSFAVARGIGDSLTNYPANENWFLQLLFLGAYERALPPYLCRPERALGSVALQTNDVEAALEESGRNGFDGSVLLDTMHWLSRAKRVRVWVALHRALRPGARVTIRTLAPGSEPPASRFTPLPIGRSDRTGCYLEAKAYERR